MTAYLLDTNVVSEPTKKRPAQAVLDWLAREDDVYLSVLTIGELRRGTAMLRESDPERADALETWIDRLEERYRPRILPVDLAVARVWALLPATRTRPVVDALIAATALAHGLTIATRNTRDMEGTGAGMLNPFEE